jgi:hypothetical protein
VLHKQASTNRRFRVRTDSQTSRSCPTSSAGSETTSRFLGLLLAEHVLRAKGWALSTHRTLGRMPPGNSCWRTHQPDEVRARTPGPRARRGLARVPRPTPPLPAAGIWSSPDENGASEVGASDTTRGRCRRNSYRLPLPCTQRRQRSWGRHRTRNPPALSAARSQSESGAGPRQLPKLCDDPPACPILVYLLSCSMSHSQRGCTGGSSVSHNSPDHPHKLRGTPHTQIVVLLFLVT